MSLALGVVSVLVSAFVTWYLAVSLKWLLTTPVEVWPALLVFFWQLSPFVGWGLFLALCQAVLALVWNIRNEVLRRREPGSVYLLYTNPILLAWLRLWMYIKAQGGTS